MGRVIVASGTASAKVQVPITPEDRRVAAIPPLGERAEFTQLTVIKLALQLLERRAELPAGQRRLLETALAATDRLGGHVLERVLERRRLERSGATGDLQDDRADEGDDAITAQGCSSVGHPEGGRWASCPLAAADQDLRP